MRTPVQLLVSVRSVAEAEEAIAGGADLIDVKEPSHGPLGRADDVTLQAIRQAVAGRRTLSAALGELSDQPLPPPATFDFVKWGLANVRGDWRAAWEAFAASASPSHPVFVAYADFPCAQAPAVDDVLAFAEERRHPVVLIDTACKAPSRDGRRPTLLDWLSVDDLKRAIDRIHGVEGRIALAGCLDLAVLDAILPLQPDWIAVRGAACQGGDRGDAIDRNRVSQLKQILT